MSNDVGSPFIKGDTIMARRKQTSIIDVTGLSIRDIMDIDLDTFNSLNERELRAITSRLVSASNKRIRRLQEHGISSPALYSLGSDKVFSTKLPTDISTQQRVNKLRSEFARARNFLGMKTSTISGYRKYEKQVRKDLESQMGRSLSNEEITQAYRILHKLQSTGQVSGRGSMGSHQARKMIFEQLQENPNGFDDDIMKSTMNSYEEEFEDNPESQFESYR